jgi:hypothetical protein
MDERGMDEVMEFHIALVKDTPKAQQAALDAFAAGGRELTHTEKATSILHTNMYFRRPKRPGQPRPPDLTPVMSDFTRAMYWFLGITLLLVLLSTLFIV